MTGETISNISTLLKMQGIVKTFPGVKANDGIDLEVKPGEVHALLGENGAGKTTLMRALVGLYKIDAGKVFWKGDEVHISSPAHAGELGIGMVHQQFSLIPTFTVAENVALGSRNNRDFRLDLKKISSDIQNLADAYSLTINPDARIDQLSMGARQRVEIIKILYRDAKLLILDEPSSVLTPQEVKDLFRVVRKLVGEGRSVVFISHKLDEVIEISDEITVLRDGKVVGDLKRQDATPKKLSKLMVGREVLFNLEKKDRCVSDPALKIKNLNLTKDNIQVLKNVSFHVCSNEIVGIAGVAGNGQEELIQILAGLKKCDSGLVTIEDSNITNASPEKIKQKGLSYMPSDRRGTGLVLQMNLSENIILRDSNIPKFSKNGFIKHKAVEEYSNQLIKDYDIRIANESVKMGTLSGGNQQKVVAAREFSRNPKVLIAEQPTMGLDIGATEYVQSKLLSARDNGAAVLLISTELSEIFSISDRILVMYKGEIMGEVEPKTITLEEVGLMMAGSRLESLLSESM